jgi:methyl-accepting chemotaxis protein
MVNNLKNLKQLTIKMRFTMIISVLVIGFLLFGFATFKAMNTVNLDSPIYHQIVQSKDIVADFLPPPEYIIESYLVALQLVQTTDPTEIKVLATRFQALNTEYETRHRYWSDQPMGLELRASILEHTYQPAQAFYNEANLRFLPSIQVGDRDVSAASFLKMRHAYEEHRIAINEVVKLATDKTVEDEQLARSTRGWYKVILGCIFSFSVLVTAVLTILVSRGILRSLKTIQQVAGAIALGDLSSSIDIHQGDEIGDLLRSMKTMQDSINGFVAGLDIMTQKHAEGWIHEKIDAVQLPGTYGKMAKELNELVASHVAVKMQVVEVVGQYAKGDFSRDMDRLPGDKAKVTAAIDSVKTALLAISNEIKILVEAGVNGDFSMRSDANRFEFMFKGILTDLNNLIETCDVGFNDVLSVAIALAQGDLTQSITRDYPGLFGQTKDGINRTVENLRNMIGEIQEASNIISTAAKEIAAGNNDLSHRTEEQAASLEETAASMEELTSTVQANSQNAKHANQLAVGASDIAGKGVNVIGQVVSTMEGINDSSRKVEDIIAVIDGIAFQTNILALNAAVEAARAGEQGRGFAVVAVEVRNLAQRATAAAAEIKGLIGDSVEKVNDGTKLVAQAGLTMQEIVSAIRGVTVIMSEISAASVEQTSGIEQVNQAIGQMDDVTQQNAALVEQAAAAAESMEEQTQNLAVTLAHFKLDGDIHRPASSFNTKPASSFSQTSWKNVPVKVESYENTPVSNDIGIDFDGVLAKHSAWKVKLRTAISKHEEMDVKTIARDDCCDFGKWLNGDAKSQFGHRASYIECVSKHGDFHIEAGRVATMINAKKYDEARSMLGNGSPFGSASTIVGIAIMRMRKDISSSSSAAVVKPKTSETKTNTNEWEEF